MKKDYFKLLIVFLFVLVLLQDKAYAYINPGSGSDFFQIIMSTILGIFAGCKNFILGVFGKNKGKKDKYE